LTENVYFDTSLFLRAHAGELANVPHIPLKQPELPSSPASDAESRAQGSAELMHNVGGTSGQNLAPVGTSKSARAASEMGRDRQAQATETKADGVKRHDPAPVGTGSF
jgi:hypothetical protein